MPFRLALVRMHLLMRRCRALFSEERFMAELLAVVDRLEARGSEEARAG